MAAYLPWLAVLLLMGLLAWFAWDMRSILKSGQVKNQLSIDGRWKELEHFFERGGRARRPFVWLHQNYLLPGNLATRHALFLYKRGQLDQALSKVDEAIRQIQKKPRLFRSIHASGTLKTLCGALRTRALILSGMGRYDESRKAIAELGKLTGPHSKPSVALAFVEYYCGHLDAALAVGLATSEKDSQRDAMQGIMALCHTLKGDFEKALQSLSYKPSDPSKFYSPAALNTLSNTPEGAKLIALQRVKLAGLFPPGRSVKLAHVYLAMEDFEKAGRALDDAEKSLGSEPALQLAYCRHRACCLAGQQNSTETEKYLERMRAIVNEHPKRSLLWKAHLSAGRAYLYLRRFNEALAELVTAQQTVLHPIEKHETAYWIAKAHEDAGNRQEATPYYQIVAADNIPSWMREQAIKALAQA